MEVHAHSHLASGETHTERKKWYHYIWEFLMLFLAVFAGFLAENQREHYIEHQREKQYISSLIKDIETDTVNIRKMMGWYKYIERSCDSLLNDFGSIGKFYTVKSGRLFSNIINGYPDFIYSDRTMQQLKNAGGLRLIRNLTAVDSIMNYDARARDILLEEEMIDVYWQKLNEFANTFLNYRRGDEQTKIKTREQLEKEKINFWMFTDAKDAEHLYNMIRYYNRTIRNYIRQLSELKNNGAGLITQLNNQYHIN